ncbi:pre-mRNA cleavage complex II protein family [Striga asiatica]|uniref:Pre-mRNA cleavage complex II protein family n=1 Tax=Striga asiatica TaxID=4170 RepID=A0A5A7PW06_STRAF|nr:pre-mRNA cleavage complex II protein family [Striga asiatica]
MAPGLVRNPKARIIPNNSRQSLKEHLTKTGGLTKSNTRKTDMASDKVNKGLAITDGSFIRSENANPTFEGNIATIQPQPQPPQTQQKESTLMPEVQTPQTQQNELQNQSQPHGSTPDSSSHQGNQHSQSPQADIIDLTIPCLKTPERYAIHNLS